MDNTDSKTTVVVTGAAGPVGSALIAGLDNDERVARIIGVDTTESQMPVGKLELRTIDLRDAVLTTAFAGADVVVHTDRVTVATADPHVEYSQMVNGTRSVVDAVSRAGVPRYVHVSDATAYGAHVDNPVPLGEDTPLRANPDFTPGYYHQLAEELVSGFAETHPEVDVTVVRPAATFGAGADSSLGRHLQAPLLVTDAAVQAPVQVVHVEDLAAALHRLALDGPSGIFNVSAERPLSAEDAATVLGSLVLRVPSALLESGVRWRWSLGLWSTPPAFLHLLRHPVVLSSAKLADTGWRPRRDSRQVLREFAAANADTWRLGPATVHKRSLVTGVLVAIATLVVGRRLLRRR